MKDKILKIVKENTMLIVLVLVVIFFNITTHGTMLLPSQFNALITQNAYVYVLATGMLMCMLTGGNIDLSCGSFVCLVGVLGAKLMVEKGAPTPVGMIAMLAIGVIYGCVLGFVIAYMNIPPWIATLAGFLALRGWGVALMHGASNISPLPENFCGLFTGKMNDLFGGPRIGGVQYNMTSIVIGLIASVIVVFLLVRERATKIKKGYDHDSMAKVIVKSVLICFAIMLFAYKFALAGGVPFALVWVAVIVIIYSFITSKTDIGRYFYTIGGNAEATRLSGIDTKRIMFIAYLNMAILTVVSAWLTMSRFQAANSTAGTNYEMDAISACVVGGVSAYGGSGTVFGMIIGATLIGVINLGMSLMGIDANWQKVVKGVVLLGAVVFEILNNKKKAVK
ncbi:putative multiple sugar transport system permease protein [Pseudobutyrivibrio sp. YE44]|uniref:ABC transporter permease subunit n=1 Tax=Pseudobutyrivibrio sp. YE44 TaxID=1520802 RepID=UPI0008902B10|nr:sugar ABC transporter permease [Pseudobutyrivibrio sp. YE44]SDB22892.1 putative multiple sugar transport system permease protein [Pseudobutyrivibrio sp. YE44]